jgi:fatty-acyl-CoA synthase
MSMASTMEAAVNTAAGPTYIERIIWQLTHAAGRKAVLSCQGVDVTATELLAAIYSHARSLSALGIGRGSLVALLAPNRPEALAVRYAANFLGAAACFLSSPPTARARVQLIQNVDPSVLVVFRETLHLVPTGLGITTVAVGDCGSELLRLDQITTSSSDLPACRADPSALAIVVSSGGSTGVPKGSCRNFAAYTRMVDVPGRADRRQLVNGRLAYLSQVLVDMTLMSGGFVVLRDHFDPVDTLAQIEQQRITDLFLVEPQLFELMDHPDVETRDLSSLHTLVHVGASAPPRLRQRAWNRLGAVIAHTYGASEQGLVTRLSPSEHDSRVEDFWSCAGRLLPGVELRLRRPDGSLAGTNQPGIIEVRSPAMAQGYRNRPELTARAYVDGWFHSGDLAYVDGKGYLHVLGRAEDVTLGERGLISPTALENTLCGVPSVRYAVVVVDPEQHARVAAVVPWSGSVVNSAECHQAVGAEHGADVADSLVIVPFERIPLTEQGKPDRQALLAAHSPGIDNPPVVPRLILCAV